MKKKMINGLIYISKCIVAALIIWATGFVLGFTQPEINCDCAMPELIECGGCGAGIYEYWQVRNDDNTKFVKVCEFCYENCLNA